jgi:hypothetical protein
VARAGSTGVVRQGLTQHDLLEKLKPGDHVKVTGRAKRGDAVMPLLPDEMEHPRHGVLWSRRL